MRGVRLEVQRCGCADDARSLDRRGWPASAEPVALENAFFTAPWQEAWSGQRSQNEGGNGSLRKSALDSIDNLKFHLPHGRIAQILLNAVIILVAKPQSHSTIPARPRHPAAHNQHAAYRTPERPAHRPTPVGTAPDRACQASATQVTRPRRAPSPESPTCLRHGHEWSRRHGLFPQVRGAAPGPPPHQPLTGPITRPGGPRNDEKPASHMTQPAIRERIEDDLVNVPTVAVVSEGGLEPPRPIKGTSTSS